MPKKRTSRIYWRNGRAYADLRDLGGGREALIPENEKRATTDADVATHLAAARVKELKEGSKRQVILGVGPSTGLAEFAAHHLVEKAKLEDVTDRWLHESEFRLREAIAFFGTDFSLDRIDTDDIKRYLKHLKTQDNGRGGRISGGTQRHYLNALSNMLATAVEERLIRFNPVSSLRRGTRPKSARTEAKWFEPHEAALILEAALRFKSPRPLVAMKFTGPLVATFLLSGGRKAELLGLRAEDVSFDRGIIHIRPNEHRRLKTRTSHRTLPLWPQLREILQRHIFDDGHVSGLLFPSPAGTGMIWELEKMLDGIAKVLGWEKGSIRSKMFRHTYCAARLQSLDHGSPVSPWTVAREMGHGGRNLVDEVYGHLGTQRHRAEVVEFVLKDQLDQLQGQAKEGRKYPEAKRALEVLAGQVERLGWQL